MDNRPIADTDAEMWRMTAQQERAEEKRQVMILLALTRHWNGGRGILVPHVLAKKLRALGFTERDGFFESRVLKAER